MIAGRPRLTPSGSGLLEATDAHWNDWRWQLSHRFSTEEQFAKILSLTCEERQALRRRDGRMRCAVTPYYARLIDPQDPDDPLRLTVVPRPAEFETSEDGYVDPCGEEADETVPGLVHRYPDRVLVLPTNQCPVYCRYCTRGRWVGRPVPYMSEESRSRVIAYLEAHPEIRDVLVSGGDPLLAPDDKLMELLTTLRGVKSVEILRLGTKVVATLPMRITAALVERLRTVHPLWISVHFVHPKEITPEVEDACARLADGGIPLNAQIVLLRGVNDDPATMKRLCQQLVRIRVRPYYLYQCDPVQWGRHFRTSVRKGLDIIEALRGHTTGFAVPTYVIDAPGGGGKIPLQPDYVERDEGEVLQLRNYAGKRYLHREPT
jgi:lysine 2,3-aminomutase